MRIGNWKRSQSNSGYYIKKENKLPEFIWIDNINSDEYGNKFAVMIRNGVNGESRIFGYSKNRADAKTKLINHMKKFPRGAN